MSEDDLTKPERAAEIAWAKRVRGRIFDCGGCPCCTKREELWGKAVCGLTPPQRFPLCLRDHFDLDRERLAA